MDGWYDDPGRLLDSAERAWVVLRVALCWLVVLGAPLYWFWFGTRFPDPDQWPLDAWSTGLFFTTAVFWGGAAAQMLLPWALRGTVVRSRGQVGALAVRGRRVVDLGPGTVLQRWRVPNLKGGAETWWSVRRDRTWLLVPDDPLLGAGEWAGVGSDVRDSSWLGAAVRGWGVLLLYVLLTLVGGLLGVVVVESASL